MLIDVGPSVVDIVKICDVISHEIFEATRRSSLKYQSIFYWDNSELTINNEKIPKDSQVYNCLKEGNASNVKKCTRKLVFTIKVYESNAVDPHDCFLKANVCNLPAIKALTGVHEEDFTQNDNRFEVWFSYCEKKHVSKAFDKIVERLRRIII